MYNFSTDIELFAFCQHDRFADLQFTQTEERDEGTIKSKEYLPSGMKTLAFKARYLIGEYTDE